MSSFLSFHLSDDFLSGYANQTPPFGYRDAGGNSLGEITFLRTYSRKKDDGTKESWVDVCARVINGMYSLQKDHCKTNRLPWNDVKAQASAQEAFDRLFNFKWTPPGRGLWVMGTPIVNEQRNSAALQNCFRGTEKFITREHGPVAFRDVLDEAVTVQTANGWAPAVVREFGRQSVQRITFAPADKNSRGAGTRIMRSNHRVDVVATPNHRWILVDGTQTTALAVGDAVDTQVVSADKESEDYISGLRHGLVFGDGTAGYQYKNGDREFHIRLCGAKAQAHVGVFSDVNYTVPSYNGDPWARTRSNQDLKSFPPLASSTDYLAGFLDGWIAADSSSAPAADTVILSSQHINALDWLETYAASAGWVIRGSNFDPIRETNFGIRKAPLRRITLTQAPRAWKVTAIEPLEEEEPVYCATVEDAGAFTLASGIYTGNCAFVSTMEMTKPNPAKPFAFLMEASMLGVGVGFDDKGADKEFTIYAPNTEEPVEYVVPDTREGWVESVTLLINSYLRPNRAAIQFDYSLVRPAGEPIKTFGGTAAGPDPLIRLHDQISGLFEGREGELVTRRDIADIGNLIGVCVVSGNVRRSAELLVGSIEDEDFLNLKNSDAFPERNKPGTGWGYMSNNSVDVSVGQNLDPIIDGVARNGEPGVLWMDISRKYGRLADAPDNRDHRVMGYNPCAEQSLESFEMCVSGDTKIHTRHGLHAISELVGAPTDIWNGVEWTEVTPFSTGRNALYRVTLSDGSYLDATPKHQWSIRSGRGYKKVSTDELKIGDKLPEFSLESVGGIRFEDAYRWGWFTGDGYVDGNRYAVAIVQEHEMETVGVRLGGRTRPTRYDRRTGNPWIPVVLDKFISIEDAQFMRKEDRLHADVFTWDSESISEFMGGWIDADGSLIQNPATDHYVLYGSEGKLRDAQMLLRRIGINHATLRRFASKGDVTNFGTRNQDLYRLLIPSYEAQAIATQLKQAKRFGSRYKTNNAHPTTKIDAARKQKIVSIELVSTDSETFCFTEPKTSMGVFGNVLTHQCTLVETYLNRHDSLEDYKRTLKFAYLYAKTVTLLPTHWEETNAIMQRNRRIGTSMSGVANFADTRGLPVLREWMDKGYETVQYYDNIYSEWLGIRESIKTTTVKPSGTVSILAGESPGVHWTPGGKHFLRTIRFSNLDPMLPLFKMAQYRVEPAYETPDTTSVVYFPIESGAQRSDKEVTIFEKIALAAQAQRYWSDNSVSVTVSFNAETESQHVGTVLHMYDGQLKTVSFLPQGNDIYPQQPYTQISEDEYAEYTYQLLPIDFSGIYEGLGQDAIGEAFCTTDACVMRVEETTINVTK